MEKPTISFPYTIEGTVFKSIDQLQRTFWNATTEEADRLTDEFKDAGVNLVAFVNDPSLYLAASVPTMEKKHTPGPWPKTIVARKDNRIMGYWHQRFEALTHKILKNQMELYGEFDSGELNENFEHAKEYIIKKYESGIELSIESVVVVEANARLIAGAPETAEERDRLKLVNAQLLEALEEMNRWVATNFPEHGMMHEYGTCASFNRMRKAIKRAK